jgi:hypothetical protein
VGSTGKESVSRATEICMLLTTGLGLLLYFRLHCNCTSYEVVYSGAAPNLGPPLRVGPQRLVQPPKPRWPARVRLGEAHPLPHAAGHFLLDVANIFIYLFIISYTDMPVGAPVPLPAKYKGNRTV